MRGIAARSRPSVHRDSDKVQHDARQVFDRLYGREISDGEFEDIRVNLVRFVSILKRWEGAHQQTRRSPLQSTDDENSPDER